MVTYFKSTFSDTIKEDTLEMQKHVSYQMRSPFLSSKYSNISYPSFMLLKSFKGFYERALFLYKHSFGAIKNLQLELVRYFGSKRNIVKITHALIPIPTNVSIR